MQFSEDSYTERPKLPMMNYHDISDDDIMQILEDIESDSEEDRPPMVTGESGCTTLQLSGKGALQAHFVDTIFAAT